MTATELVTIAEAARRLGVPGGDLFLFACQGLIPAPIPSVVFFRRGAHWTRPVWRVLLPWPEVAEAVRAIAPEVEFGRALAESRACLPARQAAPPGFDAERGPA